MATQITHIVLAERVYPELLGKDAKPDFMIGTTFPDIRYLGDVSRERTHFYHIDLQDVLAEENPFVAGQKFHCLLDLVREDFVVEQDIYNHCPDSPLSMTSLKFFEDEVLYSKLDSWQELGAYYDIVLKEEREFTIPEEHLRLWHNSVKNYISQPPSDASRLQHGTDLGLSAERIQSFNSVMNEIRKSTAVREYVERLYEELPTLLKKWEKRVFNGLLLRESLSDEKVLSHLTITKEETWNVSNATSNQPAVWHALYYEGPEPRANDLANELAASLKQGEWYTNFSTSKGDVYVVFPGKVYRYRKGDTQAGQEAIQFGRSIGIAESQLDWEE